MPMTPLFLTECEAASGSVYSLLDEWLHGIGRANHCPDLSVLRALVAFLQGKSFCLPGAGAVAIAPANAPNTLVVAQGQGAEALVNPSHDSRVVRTALFERFLFGCGTTGKIVAHANLRGLRRVGDGSVGAGINGHDIVRLDVIGQAQRRGASHDQEPNVTKIHDNLRLKETQVLSFHLAATGTRNATLCRY